MCLTAAAVICGIGTLPAKILSSSDRYMVIAPQQYQYQPKLSCNGVVMAEEGVKLMVSTNLIIKEVLVEDGSWVEAGEVIATTETPTPEAAFLTQSIEIPSGVNPSQLESMAAQYGIDVPATGSLDALKEQLKPVAAAPRMAVAPISGIVAWNAVSPGRYVPAGSQLCTILGLDRYKAVVQVAADKASLVYPGDTVVITGSEIDQKQYSGKVTAISDTVTKGLTTGGYSSTIQVEVAIDAPADSMRHGASISCTILTGEPQNILTLPYEAVHQDERNNEFVYCVAGSRLQKKLIKTGLELDDAIQVLEGLEPRDVVATGNADGKGTRFVLEEGGTSCTP